MARRYATIFRCDDGSLWVRFRYADPERGERSGQRLDQGKSLEGVAFEQWRRTSASAWIFRRGTARGRE